MRVISSLEELREQSFPRGSAVTIGKFDGMHRGHRALIAKLRELAAERNLETVVLTFANHPMSLLDPATCPQPIMSPAQRIDALRELGVDTCLMLDFTEELSSIPAESFVSDLLVRSLDMRLVLVGADFRFGHFGAGDVSLLRRLGNETGAVPFETVVLDTVADGSTVRVSSTRIRQAMVDGDVEAAALMLGRPTSMSGTVVRGDARGRELGFPTANLGGALTGIHPADGVYAGWATVAAARHPAAISVGTNPTFTPEGTVRVEAFLLDFEGDLYGQSITVEFSHRIRGMVAFEGVPSLIEQMSDDVMRTRALLGLSK